MFFLTAEEKIVVNSIFENDLPAMSLNKDDFSIALMFSAKVSNKEAQTMLEGLKAKFDKLSNEEWEHLKKLVPLKTPYFVDN